MREAPANAIGIRGKDGVYEIYGAIINASSAGDNTIVAPKIGMRIRVLGIKYSCAGNVGITWKSGTGGAASAIVDSDGTELPEESFAARGGMSDFWGPHGWFFQAKSGEALNMSLSAAVQVSGWINYTLVPGE